MFNMKWLLYRCGGVWLWNEIVAIQCKLWKSQHCIHHAYIPITIEWPNTDLIQAFPFLRTHVLWSINAHQWKDSYRISQYCQNALKPNGQKKLYKMYRYKKNVSMMTPYCVNIEVYEYHVENGRNWMAQWSQRAAQSIPGTRKTIQNVAWSISGTRKKNPLALTACKVLGTDNKITSPYLWSTKILGWTIKSADFWVVIYFLQEFDCLNLSCSDQMGRVLIHNSFF